MFLELLNTIQTSLEKYIIPDIVDIIVYEYYLPKDGKMGLDEWSKYYSIPIEKTITFYDNIESIYYYDVNIKSIDTILVLIGRYKDRTYFYYEQCINGYGDTIELISDFFKGIHDLSKYLLDIDLF
jgi:hypothetical protein